MHACRGQLLGNLSILLITRFECRGSDEDLDQANTLHSELLASRPVGHPHHYSSPMDIANQLSVRFRHREDAKDLDDATVLSKEALALHPIGHPDRSLSLSNLTNRLSTRFDHREAEKENG
ncbi:hypothetical protein EDD22DRAFT_912733 [Suillus occidentalis]|nr:hypothetical protein EDD22DRAFT_912733 [Suillus occidentalis]